METERLNKLKRLLEIYNMPHNNMPYEIIKEVYDLNNYFMPHSLENAIGCDSCQNRVKNKLFEFFDNVGRPELNAFELTINTPNDEPNT